jgi:hypothetical protein
VDDPDPEAGPCLEPLVAGAARQVERRLEVLELARVLLAALGEEAGVQDPAALGLQTRLGSVELARGELAGLGRPGEERLLVQEVRAQQRVVARELERLVPAALPAQPRDLGAAHPRSRSISAQGRVFRIRSGVSHARRA